MFFSNGVTIAVFHLQRNAPDCSDGLMILVIADKMLGRMLFSKVVGIGSSSHDVDLVLITNLCTWSSSSFLKLLNSGISDLDGWYRGWSSNSSLILTILLKKKFANASASSLSEFWSWNNFSLSEQHSSIFILIFLFSFPLTWFGTVF